MLKKIIIVLLVLVGIYLILCVAGPKKMDVSTTQMVTGTPEQVYSQIIDFKNWPHWSKWIKDDTAMVLSFGNPSSGVGGTYSWKSEESGSGNMKITEAVPNQMLKADLVFDEWKSVSKVTMELKPNGKNTDLTWKMQGETELPFLLRGIMLVTNMDARVKKDFDKGLANMDEYIKSGKAGVSINGYQISESSYPTTNFLGKRATVSFKDMSAFFSSHFPEIAKLAGDKIVGPPCGLYWDWDPKSQKTDMAAAMPVNLSEFLNDTYKIIAVPASKQFTIDYLGHFSKMQGAYAALDSILKTKGLTHPEQVIEEYLTDPMVEKDTTKWLTRIHYLFK